MADSFLERFQTRAKRRNSEDWESQEATDDADDEGKKAQDRGDRGIRQMSRGGGDTRIREEPSVAGFAWQDNAAACEGAGGARAEPGVKLGGCAGAGSDGALGSETRQSGDTSRDHDAIGEDFELLDMQESDLTDEFMHHVDRYLLRPAADDLEPLADSSEDVDKYGSHTRSKVASEGIAQSLAHEDKPGGGGRDLARTPPEGTVSSAEAEDAAASSARPAGGDDAELWHRSPMFTKHAGNTNAFQYAVPSGETPQLVMGKDGCPSDASVPTTDTADRAVRSMPVEKIRAKKPDTDGQNTSTIRLPPPSQSPRATLDSSSPFQCPPCPSQSPRAMSPQLPPVLASPQARSLQLSSGSSPLNSLSDSNISPPGADTGTRSPASGRPEDGEAQEFTFADVADGGDSESHRFDGVQRSSSPLDFTIQKQRASLGKSGALGNRKPGKPQASNADPEWIYRDSSESPIAQLPIEEPPTQKRGLPGGFRLPALGPSFPGVQMLRKTAPNDDGDVSPKPQTKELFKSKSSLGLPVPGAWRLLPAAAGDDADKPGSEPPKWLKELKSKQKKPVKE